MKHATLFAAIGIVMLLGVASFSDAAVLAENQSILRNRNALKIGARRSDAKKVAHTQKKDKPHSGVVAHSQPHNSVVAALNPDTVTVSGISAGGAFAIQYEFAFSKSVKATAVAAGLPYYCAQGLEAYAFMCMDNELIDILGLILDAAENADIGLIDPLSYVSQHNVWLWSGTLDTVVSHGAMQQVQAMYELLNVTNVMTIFNYSAEHSWPTSDFGNACWYLGHPYINNCGYDFGGHFLADSFAKLGLKWNATKGQYNPDNMQHFNLAPFGADPFTNSLDTTSYVYVPSQCAGNSSKVKCHFHVNFHGCKQYRTHFNDHTQYVAHTELNQWAESNNIVVFYPQAIANDLLGNPNGCFDWWGYAGSDYATNEGAQMSIIYAAAQSLLGTS